LRDVPGAAVDREVSAARSVISWAVPEDVLDCLYSLATLASDLLRGVLWEETLCEGAYKGVSCDNSVEGGYGTLREGGLSFSWLCLVMVRAVRSFSLMGSCMLECWVEEGRIRREGRRDRTRKEERRRKNGYLRTRVRCPLRAFSGAYCFRGDVRVVTVFGTS